MVEAEPGVDEEALAALQRSGWPVQRFRERSLYFGGVQAVARDPETGELSGGGDPRRGGSSGRVEQQARARGLAVPAAFAVLVGPPPPRGPGRPGEWRPRERVRPE